MSRTKKIAVLAIIAMVLTMLPVQLFAATTAGESTRLFGAGRVETALEVCKAGWSTADTVIVAPADQANLVDALAAAPLAGQENAPILLTFKDTLDAAVKAKISALGAKKVYVVGAVSDGVKSEIDAISGVTVEALKGASRWETAKAINAKLTSPAGCFVVGYNALPDALSVSSFAAANKYAVILADVKGQIPAGQTVLGSKTYLVGGPTLVADISGATRLAGADRFETNIAVINGLSYEYGKIYVANGMTNHLVDSLVAAPLAAKTKSAIVLASDSAIPDLAAVKAKIGSATAVVALGGTGVVADSVVNSIKYVAPASVAVEDIVPISLNAFKVTFNQKVDEDTAELVSNYKVNGSTLQQYSAGPPAIPGDSAVLQSDGKSVIVWLDKTHVIRQNDKITVEVVKNVVYDDAKKTSAPGFTKELAVSDVTVPTITSVKATGNKKLTVTFSEPVNVPALSDVQSWQINGTNLSAKGLTSVVNKNATKSAATADEMAYAYDLYFGTALSSGAQTLKVKDGTAARLSDNAGFIFKESTAEFTVENVTGSPSIESVTAEQGTIYVAFNRSMAKDSAGSDNTNVDSAININQYNLNDSGYGVTSVSAASYKSNTSDKVVKLTPATGKVKEGINVIEIDKDLKDAWGNKLSTGSDNIRMSFTYAKDTTKPSVLTVTCVTSSKIRINMSEKVTKASATNANNYTLKKSDGTPIPVTASLVPASETTSSDTIELSTGATKLDGTNYSLKIKNLEDAAPIANVMDTYTATFDGIDDVGPNLTQAIDQTNTHKVAIFFTEALDPATVIVDNFGYTDGTLPTGEARNLPTGSSVSLDGTNKIVTITFPDAYTVNAGGAGLSNDKYEVVAVRASNVKDKAGNLIQGIAQTKNIEPSTAAAVAPTFTVDSFNLYDDGDNVRAEFMMNQEITSLNISDFIVGAPDTIGAADPLAAPTCTVGVAPDSGYTEGKKVVLKFTQSYKVDIVRYAGPYAYLKTTLDPQSTNTAGVKINAIADLTAAARVYDDQVKPRIVSYTLVENANNALADTLLVAFSERIDTSITGLYDDDFQATGSTTVGGITTSTAPGVGVPAAGGVNNYNVLSFSLAANGGTYDGGAVLVKAIESKISIRDAKDRGPEDYNTLYLTSNNKDGQNAAVDATGPVVSAWYLDLNRSGNDKNIVVVANEALGAVGAFGTFAYSAASAAWGGAGSTALTAGVPVKVGAKEVMINTLGATQAAALAGAHGFLEINAGALTDINTVGNASVASTAGVANTGYVADTTAATRILSVAGAVGAAAAVVTASDYLASNTVGAPSWVLGGNAVGATITDNNTVYTVTYAAKVVAANDTIQLPVNDYATSACNTSYDVATMTASGWTIN